LNVKLSFTYENSSSGRFKYNAAHRLRYLFPLAMIIKKEFISAQPDVQAITMRNDKISTQAIDTICDVMN